MSEQLTIAALNRELDLAEERIKKLEEALKDAADAITGEFCSHNPSPCGANNDRCYSQDFYHLLETKWERLR